MLSIVTVCMNRRGHLLRSAAAVSRWPHHGEHLIVDWSSREPLRRADLPADPRLRLLRVEGERRWNLCRAYNFAIARASGERILKLDADAWPSERFDPAAVPGCASGSGPEGRKGQFLIARGQFEAVGGFHELLLGYGFDDKDLLIRLARAGVETAALPADWLEVIPHTDEERAGQERAGAGRWLLASQGQASMRATRLANRLIAAHCPWGPDRPTSRYRETAAGLWELEPGSLPEPPAEVAAEVEHVRRMTFWGAFLAIPEVGLEVLPFSLFPPAVEGRWPVRWWHRLWWRSGRRLLLLPVKAVVAGRAALVSCASSRARSAASARSAPRP